MFIYFDCKQSSFIFFIIGAYFCDSVQRAPSCLSCPKTNDTAFNSWCQGNCYFDEINSVCKEKSKFHCGPMTIFLYNLNLKPFKHSNIQTFFIRQMIILWFRIFLALISTPPHITSYWAKQNLLVHPSLNVLGYTGPHRIERNFLLAMALLRRRNKKIFTKKMSCKVMNGLVRFTKHTMIP